MSDRRYRDTVTVVADGKTVKGCGGGILAPEELAGTNWRFVSVGGVPVAQDRPTSLAFRSEEHTSELQSLMRISYAVFCLKKKKTQTAKHTTIMRTQYHTRPKKKQ